MKNLLVIGCSYSALYYHPDPRWSYTWLLKEALGAENLINLSYGGNSPSGCTRTLDWYLRNQLKGKPDCIYIQVPNGAREEYYLTGTEWEYIQEATIVCTNESMYKTNDDYNDSSSIANVRSDVAFQDYEKFRRSEDKNFASNKELVDDVPWDQIVAVGGTFFYEKEEFSHNWVNEFMRHEYKNSVFLTSDSIANVNASWHKSRKVENKKYREVIEDLHRLWVAQKFPKVACYHAVRREVSIMQMLAKRHNIPIFFNSTDNFWKEKGKGEFETFDDIPTHYDSMIDWDYFIKYESISNFSRTDAGDPYYDRHPGRQSHENYFNAIWPQVKSLLS